MVKVLRNINSNIVVEN